MSKGYTIVSLLHRATSDAELRLIAAWDFAPSHRALSAFSGEVDYPSDIGLGVYDIHSPRIPSVEEIERLLELAEARIGRKRLWVNPDCGLKTRRWDETLSALENMLQAARRRRAVTAVEA